MKIFSFSNPDTVAHCVARLREGVAKLSQVSQDILIRPESVDVFTKGAVALKGLETKQLNLRSQIVFLAGFLP